MNEELRNNFDSIVQMLLDNPEALELGREVAELRDRLSDDNNYIGKTFYFEDLSGTNFTFYLVTEKNHSVTLIATDVNKRVSDSFSTTAQ